MSPREQYLEEKVKHLLEDNELQLDIIKGLEIELEQAVEDLRSVEVEAYQDGYQDGLADSSYER